MDVGADRPGLATSYLSTTQHHSRGSASPMSVRSPTARSHEPRSWACLTSARGGGSLGLLAMQVRSGTPISTASSAVRRRRATRHGQRRGSVRPSRRRSTNRISTAGTRRSRRFATTLTTKADEDLARGHRVSRGQYLRACRWVQKAFFYRRADLSDHDLHATLPNTQRRCFRATLPLFDHPVTVLEVAGDDREEYGGYFATPPGAGPWPTVVMPGGYDGTAEELGPTVVEAMTAAMPPMCRTEPARAACWGPAHGDATGLGGGAAGRRGPRSAARPDVEFEDVSS